MAHTKKIGSAGRFGVRYGLRLRKKVLEIEQFQRQKQKCPFCLKFTAKRLASGIWLCRHCNTKFAGRAYEPGITGKPMLEVPKVIEEIKPEEKKTEEKGKEKRPGKKKKIKFEKEAQKTEEAGEAGEFPEVQEDLINEESLEESQEDE